MKNVMMVKTMPYIDVVVNSFISSAYQELMYDTVFSRTIYISGIRTHLPKMHCTLRKYCVKFGTYFIDYHTNTMLQLVYRQDRMPLDATVSCNSGRKVSRAKMDYDLH